MIAGTSSPPSATTVASITARAVTAIINKSATTSVASSVVADQTTSPVSSDNEILSSTSIPPTGIEDDEYSFSFSSLVSSSVSALLLGIDYIFYIWTILLVGVVTYLSIYKYYQYTQLQKRRTNNVVSIDTVIFSFLTRVLDIIRVNLGFLYEKAKDYYHKNIQYQSTETTFAQTNVTKSQQQSSATNKNTISSSPTTATTSAAATTPIITKNSTSTNATNTDPIHSSNLASNFLKSLTNVATDPIFSYNNIQDSSILCLNNCLKWFYFNSDTTNKVNQTILNILNSNCNSGISPKNNLAQSAPMSKYDDLHFKSIDTLPPKFSNMQTVVNDNDSLTLKAQMELSNIDIKVDLMRSQRQLDIKVLNASAQVLIILSQNRNQVFNLDCYLDKQSEFNLNLKKDQNVENQLLQHIENVIKTAVKQNVFSLELNFFNKNLSTNSKLINNSSNNNSPQISPQSIGSSNINNNTSLRASSPLKIATNIDNNAHKSMQMSNVAMTSSPQTSPINKITISPSPSPPPAMQSIHTQQNQQQQLSSSPSPQSSNVQQLKPQQISPILHSPGLDSNLQNSSFRNSVNEKRLLVKLLKATNLSNCEEPYCVVELDYPMQKHITDVHKDMSAIQEQFLFDIIASSEELTFSIYDRAKDYGNDLIGEAVLPVNDLCTNLNSKRVIQLHRFGQTKTGSITAEFVFIEPTTTRIEPRNNRGSTTSRSSRSPFNQNDLIQHYRDDVVSQNEPLKMSPNPQDNLSSNSFTTPIQGSFQSSTLRSYPNKGQENYQNYGTNLNVLTESAPQSRSPLMQPQQSPKPNPNNTLLTTVIQNQPGTNVTVGGSTRVINRNYLQIQSNNYNNNLNNNNNNANNNNNQNKSSTLNSNQLSNAASLYSNEQQIISDIALDGPENNKRTRSISRSLRSLFNRPPKTVVQKREKSYDSPSMYGGNYDIQSVDNLKKSKIGGSLRKLFSIKKNPSKRYEGVVVEPRPGSPSVSITVSRPIDSNSPNNTISQHVIPPTQPPLQLTDNFNSINVNTINHRNTEDAYRKEPLLLKRGYVSP